MLGIQYTKQSLFRYFTTFVAL